ncbi:UDP-N-acetylmuramoylalanyl-D-glutamyl-2,6-diaminopimelate-D-alanyl-D-alanine ligase [Gracilibacillus boraciitolerans JCM 21714]|uniref:UDP-N-acetylmuramoylalanyl-D-glutamyl-2,6-diaminopimelate-D-alanyl-D-alanine ligase n=1 Tax=Gracilibacillus boraciitolerans JCM 21714 TaxID=1298598 RepID=W4VNT6_9BACI|nr:Mur ligase family protein [Gracilibacillus boraciitolerans]GAE94877.1 UDP-N-acetylmuramoylalanyl-D-glutamyl-2,6-diaminopimelate-D-alanyl-D-alanine ligase [Gracilibacillus boraciitolerans JCM 21714]
MQIILSIVSVLWIIYLFFRVKQSIHMLQLNSYFNKRLTRWISGHWLKAFPINEWIALILAILYYFNQSWTIFLIIILGLLVPKQKQQKKKLVVTTRVKRLIITISVIYLLLIATSLHFIWNDYPLSYAVFIVVLGSLLTYGIVLLANTINRPIENAIKESYYKDAKNKIKSAKQTTTIGITGSFGKTSTKFILDTILSNHFNTLKTPNSFNTKIGVTITIRNSLKAYHDVFIAEMGAKEPGNIQEICDW